MTSCATICRVLGMILLDDAEVYKMSVILLQLLTTR